MLELTKKQNDVYEYIKLFITSNGYSPTLSEIGQHFAVAVTVARTCYVDVLERKGYIARVQGKGRTMRILK